MARRTGAFRLATGSLAAGSLAAGRSAAGRIAKGIGLLGTAWMLGCGVPGEERGTAGPSSEVRGAADETGEGAEDDRPPDAPASPDPFAVDPRHVDLRENPRLLARLRATPHNYFRFLGQPFATAVCEHFAHLDHEMPTVNLHGDAHLEQYAVTDLGRGLTDYDLATMGPAVIDLVRMGSSIDLGCRHHRFEGSVRDRAFDALLDGYLEGLMQTGPPPDEPASVAAIRASFHTERPAMLRLAQEAMEPVDAEERSRAVQTLASYFAIQHRLAPELPEGFFTVKEIGRFRIGIGSALDTKYLIRVEGPTEDPDDDEMLEAKEVQALESVPCILTGRTVDPYRILVAQSRIAYQPFPFLGFVRTESKTFWLKAWTPNYYELPVETGLTRPDVLIEIARDIGIQLGRGHIKQIAAPLGEQLRHDEAAFVRAHRADVRAAVNVLSERIVGAWQRFRRASAPQPVGREDGE
ncbi:MAG: DUF2252 family protein [Sandaracinaceae bacterium]